MQYHESSMTEYLTIKEVAAILKISRNHLNKLTKKGNIQAYRIGRSIRYKREDVDKALTQKEIQPQEPQKETA